VNEIYIFVHKCRAPRKLKESLCDTAVFCRHFIVFIHRPNNYVLFHSWHAVFIHTICCSCCRSTFLIISRFLLIDFTPAVVFDSKRFDIVFVTARDRAGGRTIIVHVGTQIRRALLLLLLLLTSCDDTSHVSCSSLSRRSGYSIVSGGPSTSHLDFTFGRNCVSGRSS